MSWTRHHVCRLPGNPVSRAWFHRTPTFLLTPCSWGRCRPPCGAVCRPRPPCPCPRLPWGPAGCSGRWGSAWSPRWAATPLSPALLLSESLNQEECRHTADRLRSLTVKSWNEEGKVIMSVALPAGLLASSPCVYWTPVCVTELTVTVWRLGRLTWPVWPKGRVWTGARVSCWVWPWPWGNWSPWSDWTPWTWKTGRETKKMELIQILSDCEGISSQWSVAALPGRSATGSDPWRWRSGPGWGRYLGWPAAHSAESDWLQSGPGPAPPGPERPPTAGWVGRWWWRWRTSPSQEEQGYQGSRNGFHQLKFKT